MTRRIIHPWMVYYCILFFSVRSRGRTFDLLRLMFTTTHYKGLQPQIGNRNCAYRYDYFDEYGISSKIPEADTSDSNEERLMFIMMEVVKKIVQHVEKDLHSESYLYGSTLRIS